MSKLSKKEERKRKKKKRQSWPRRVPAGARFSRSCNPADRSSLSQQPRAALPAADRGEDGITWQQFENPNHLLDEKKSFKDASFFCFFFFISKMQAHQENESRSHNAIWWKKVKQKNTDRHSGDDA